MHARRKIGSQEFVEIWILMSMNSKDGILKKTGVI